MTPYVRPLLVSSAIAALGMSSAGCMTARTATGCSELARTVLTTDTEHATLGDSGEELLDWQLFGTAESGQLNTANDRARTGFAIIEGCERRDAEASRSRWRFW